MPRLWPCRFNSTEYITASGFSTEEREKEKLVHEVEREREGRGGEGRGGEGRGGEGRGGEGEGEGRGWGAEGRGRGAALPTNVGVVLADSEEDHTPGALEELGGVMEVRVLQALVVYTQ